MHDDFLHPIGCQKFNLLSLPVLSELKWKQRRPPKTLAWASKKGSRMGGGNRREWPYMPLFPPYLQKIMLMKDIPICVIPSTSLNIHPIHFLFFSPPPCFCVRCRYSHPIIFFEWVQKTKKKTSEVGQPFFTQRKKKKTMAPNIIPNNLSTSSTIPWFDGVNVSFSDFVFSTPLCFIFYVLAVMGPCRYGSKRGSR